MNQGRLQTKVNVEPFSGEQKDFPKWEMDAEAIFELEGLECCLDLAFLQRLPARDQELDENNDDHQEWIKAKKMNARAYALLTTMVKGNRLVAEFARIRQLYASSDAPRAACRYWHKLQEIYRPAEKMDEV